MNKAQLPRDLQTVVGDEEIDFAIYAKRNQPKALSLGIIFFALFWLIIPSIGAYAFFGPLFKGEEVHFKSNDVPTTASLDNLEPMIVPSLLLFLFIAIGIGMFIWGILSFTKSGGYFVATKTRLINYRKGTIKYFDWEQFTGNTELTIKKNNISLEMRRGKMSTRKNGPDKFIPETLHISGIENLLEIEKICRQRIKENDPTPIQSFHVKTEEKH